MQALPGTPQHQALLGAILSHYEEDPRILAIIVFGSLGRGAWDALSDIDLDVIVADGLALDVAGEVEALCKSLAVVGECAALLIPDGDDARDVVFDSLLELSVRYHPLAATKPAILADMRILAGRLTSAEISAAAEGYGSAAEASAQQLLDQPLRYAVETGAYLQRGQLWLATETLHHARRALIDLFGLTRGSMRGIKAFESAASPSLQVRLAATLPTYGAASLQTALGHLLDLLEQDLAELANGEMSLTESQRRLLAAVRRRANERRR